MNPMFHRHLVAAYAVTWAIQLSYLGYVVAKWVAARKAGRVVVQDRQKDS